ncbi:MFS transporter (plasmid) [Halorussus limi]|uniref:MFS transporter n=1 Tax=Halorussus limi TaxID=2938695 RepID=A0A8U0I113_9EURY|nr:MFS transporter [Halorussus limi]UPV76878.1 MFS transporter [Halorussus limi]
MSFRSALSHRGFRALWFGQVASRVGDSVHEIALIWVVYEVTGDPTLLSLTFVASFLPTTVLSLPGGAIADRVNRKHLLVGSDVVRGAVVLVIPAVGRGELLVPTILAVALFTGIIDAFDGPARSAIIPQLVPDDDLESANSLKELTFSVSQMFFAGGGAVIAVVGSFDAFYVDAGSFFLSALFVLAIPSERGRPSPDEDQSPKRTFRARLRSVVRETKRDISDSLGYVADHPLLTNLVAFQVGLQFTLAPINVALPVYAPSLPLEGGFAIGLLYSAFFTGMTAGSLLVGRYDGLVHAYRGRLVVGGLPVFGLLLVLAVVRVPTTGVQTAAVLVSLALAGAVFAAVRVPVTTLGQLVVPEERLGRYSSVVGVFSSLAFVVGLGLTGPVVDAFGSRATLLGVGALGILLGGLFVGQPLGQISGEVQTRTASTGESNA